MSVGAMAVALVLARAGGETAAAQGRQKMRFPGMDRHNDGRITRATWNGSDQSFTVHDWDGDGVLAGDEVRPGARRGVHAGDVRNWNPRDLHGPGQVDPGLHQRRGDVLRPGVPQQLRALVRQRRRRPAPAFMKASTRARQEGPAGEGEW